MNLNLFILLLSFIGFQMTYSMEDRSTLLRKHTRHYRDSAADFAYTTEFNNLSSKEQEFITKNCVRPFVNEIKKLDEDALRDYSLVKGIMIKHNNKFIKGDDYIKHWLK